MRVVVLAYHSAGIPPPYSHPRRSVSLGRETIYTKSCREIRTASVLHLYLGERHRQERT